MASPYIAERILQLEPEPPKVDNLNEYILSALSEQNLLYFSFFLHHYEPQLNKRIKSFLGVENGEGYNTDRLLKSTLSQYKNFTYIAMGVSGVGMIVALVCSLAFLKTVLGFFLGAIFFVASIVCQAVFVNKAFFSVEDARLDERVLSDFKRKVINLAEMSIGLTVAFIGFTIPLILVDAYMGLGSDSLLIWGAMGASTFLLIYAIALYFLNASLLRKGVYSLSEQESVIHCHNHKLKRICAIELVVFLAITSIGHHVATSIWGPYSIMKGTTFEDYDSFVEYMEQDIPASPRHSFNGGLTAVEIPVSSEEIGTSTIMMSTEMKLAKKKH